jgi:N-acetylglutamate synthase-like GNAT family acetyltransferase
MPPDAPIQPAAPFTEKGFYLGEFRGRTLAIAVPDRALADGAALEPVLKELERNPTRVVLISADPDAVTALLGTPLLGPEDERLEGAVWRGLQRGPRVGLVVDASSGFAARCREIAVRLGVPKLVWLDRRGGLLQRDGSRWSFVDLEELSGLVQTGAMGDRTDLLRETEAALRGGVPAVNLCTPEGLGHELFSYAGSGTLFTRERYVDVRPLGVDDFAAAHDLVARGVAEGYLAPRTDRELDLVFASAVGAFVEGRHLAGIAALLPVAASNAGEIASLYTLTRFLGEGVGGHLVAALLERARAVHYDFVFACTTTEPVAGFFERLGFRRVPGEKIPDHKWQSYDPLRRPRVRCLLYDLPPTQGRP